MKSNKVELTDDQIEKLVLWIFRAAIVLIVLVVLFFTVSCFWLQWFLTKVVTG